jgi:hypothetical protein
LNNGFAYLGMISGSLAGLELEDEEEWLGISFMNY